MVIINPHSLCKPNGYNHAIKAGSILFISGQIGCNKNGKIVSSKFDVQFEKTIQNIITILNHANAKPTNIVKLNMFIKSKNEYLKSRKRLRIIYKKYIGDYYPCVTLVVVKDLFEKNAKIEIEATALL